MKVLFVIQGEGRGHLPQAITLESMLRRNGYASHARLSLLTPSARIFQP